jgi:hypothetical protein
MNPKIESYLAILERSLKQLPVSDRAEIVTEIKSHVLSAVERDPNATVDSVLQALGEPETVANRYLAERGQSFVKPSISPIVKWLVVGFLGTFALLLVFAGAVLYRFSPLIKVDNKDHVTLLGGAIDIDGAEIKGGHGSWSFSSGSGGFGGGHQVTGRAAVLAENGSLLIQAKNGKIHVQNSDDASLRWDCRIDKGKPDPAVHYQEKAMVLDLTYASGILCDLFVPAKHALKLQMENGKIFVEKPKYGLDVSLTNGKILIQPDPALAYRYDVRVERGVTDEFTSSRRADAIFIKAFVENGQMGLYEDSNADQPRSKEEE